MFSDLSRPPLNVTELRRNLTFFSSLDVVAETGSTNADLVALAASDPDSDRHVLIAESQTKGRGRHGREWVSPPQAQIAMSVLLRVPRVPVTEFGWIPLLTGIALTDALRSVAEVDAVLKWPNDVLIGDKKVAGILAEMSSGKVPAVVIGLGLNVSLKSHELPVPEATSLTLENAEVADRTTLVRAILRSFADWYTRWENAGYAASGLLAAYAERCATIGANVRAELPSGALLQGRALGVDAAGRLRIDTGSEIATVTAGDVRHVRRTD